MECVLTLIKECKSLPEAAGFREVEVGALGVLLAKLETKRIYAKVKYLSLGDRVRVPTIGQRIFDGYFTVFQKNDLNIRMCAMIDE